MKVKDLIKTLKKYDPELEICYSSGEYYDDIYYVGEEYLDGDGFVVDPDNTERENKKQVVIG